MIQLLNGTGAKCNDKKSTKAETPADTKADYHYDKEDFLQLIKRDGYEDEFKQLKAKVDGKFKQTHVIVVETDDNKILSLQMMPRTEYEKMARASKEWEDANAIVYDRFPNTRGAKVTASVAFDDYSKLRYSIAITEGKFSTISFENGEKITCSNNILFLGLSDALKLDINNQISDGEIQQIIEKSEPVMVSADAKSFDLGGGNTLESVGFDTNGNWSYWVKLPKLKQRAIKVQIEDNWSKITKSELANGTPNEKGVNQLKDYLERVYKATFDTSTVSCDDDASADDVLAELDGLSEEK